MARKSLTPWEEALRAVRRAVSEVKGCIRNHGTGEIAETSALECLDRAETWVEELVYINDLEGGGDE